MINVGQKVRFALFDKVMGFASNDYRGRDFIGTVVMINKTNKWFSVEYVCSGVKLRTSFKFSQIGKDVLICAG